jgi:molybdopterin-containing oxidoreductase family membrane subunit
VAVAALTVGVVSAGYLLYAGLGVLGLDRAVGWGVLITNFVFWIGVGHAGTFISAVLYLLRQPWRAAVSRSAEAMTLIAVLCAGLFPLIHLGRPALWFYLLPYPNSRGPLWMNFRSPLVWDMLAVGTYFTVSLGFWYWGLIPDLAALRRRVPGWRGRLYGRLSLGWDASVGTWAAYERTYFYLAALATPLVISVHSVVSLDFAVTVLPGWHSTAMPPYFVVGALYSGFALVLVLSLLARRTQEARALIGEDAVESLAKVYLALAVFMAWFYLGEVVFAWRGSEGAAWATLQERYTGEGCWRTWLMLVANIGLPQLLWHPRLRSHPGLLLGLALSTLAGMWLERWILIAGSLEQGYLPSSATALHCTVFDFGITVGAFGLFFTVYLLFLRVFPAFALSDLERAQAGEIQR